MMTDNDVLNIYKSIVPFLAQLCGPSSEVVLHDISDPSKSVIAIENGKSGRSIGSPITDLAQKIINDGDYRNTDFLANYSGITKGKSFVSSTFFIKNDNRLIGLLCVNRDTGSLTALDNALDFFKKQYNLIIPESDIQENLDAPVTTILQNMVSNAILDTGLSPAHMNMNDKVLIVHKLQEQGVMNMKGAVSEIANQLHISEPTVYRYMNKKTV